jgi:hypothetical protein
MAIHRLIANGSFEPNEIEVMTDAYEGALIDLRVTNRDDPITDLIAKSIVNVTATGERDPILIRERAMNALGVRRPTAARVRPKACPLWVISGHFAVQSPCPLYPESRHLSSQGQNRLRPFIIVSQRITAPFFSVGLFGNEAWRVSVHQLPNEPERVYLMRFKLTWWPLTTPISRSGTYEIKRGNGQFDAGKIRSITRDLKCIQVLLKNYGEFCKLQPQTAESKIIFYYGVRSIPRPWSLVKGELDEHFGFPVVERIEQANDYFRTRLHALLNAA